MHLSNSTCVTVVTTSDKSTSSPVVFKNAPRKREGVKGRHSTQYLQSTCGDRLRLSCDGKERLAQAASSSCRRKKERLAEKENKTGWRQVGASTVGSVDLDSGYEELSSGRDDLLCVGEVAIDPRWPLIHNISQARRASRLHSLSKGQNVAPELRLLVGDTGLRSHKQPRKSWVQVLAQPCSRHSEGPCTSFLIIPPVPCTEITDSVSYLHPT